MALRHLLPVRGRRLLEVGAGFGRLADLYAGYDQVILLDYAKSGLREAQARLGRSGRFIYIAADIYHLPVAPHTCDTAVTVRVLHHMIDVPAALQSLAMTLRPGGVYVLEYANKRNIKAIARYLRGRQPWSPFQADPVEFAKLNYDFHPSWMAQALARAGFRIEASRAVSYFRTPILKRAVPSQVLASLDGILQVPGAPLKLAPSVFLRCRTAGGRYGEVSAPRVSDVSALLRCPACGGHDWRSATSEAMICGQCGSHWAVDDGIYDFKTPLDITAGKY